MKQQSEASISNRVYEHRVLRKLSQRELADAVGVSKQTIFAMEKGNYAPSLTLAFKLAHYFNVDIPTLFTYNDIKENS